MLIGVISDTHGYVHPRLHDVFKGVDYILHAGDAGDDSVLDELQLIAPVTAVSGNMDGTPTARRTLTRTVTLGGVKIGMHHGHYPGAGGGSLGVRLVSLFNRERPDIIIHGHTHYAEVYSLGNVMIVNPGAACRSGVCVGAPTVALIEIRSPRDYSIEIVELAQGLQRDAPSQP
ncbi:MAG: YfcE family phosphodiesterase [bacterium]|nr:YfcE family phosphodiesterase [Candidatus Sumerlaeota bacterium]